MNRARGIRAKAIEEKDNDVPFDEHPPREFNHDRKSQSLNYRPPLHGFTPRTTTYTSFPAKSRDSKVKKNRPAVYSFDDSTTGASEYTDDASSSLFSNSSASASTNIKNEVEENTEESSFSGSAVSSLSELFSDLENAADTSTLEDNQEDDTNATFSVDTTTLLDNQEEDDTNATFSFLEEHSVGTTSFGENEEDDTNATFSDLGTTSLGDKQESKDNGEDDDGASVSSTQNSTQTESIEAKHHMRCNQGGEDTYSTIPVQENTSSKPKLFPSFFFCGSFHCFWKDDSMDNTVVASDFDGIVYSNELKEEFF